MGTCSSREGDDTPPASKFAALRAGKKGPNRPVPHAAGLHGQLSHTTSVGHTAFSQPSHRSQHSLTPSDLQDLKHRSMARKQEATTAAEKLLSAHQGKSFHDMYDKPSLMSYGASCKVLTANHKVTGAQVACKTIPKSSRNPAAQRLTVLNEISIMKEVEDHPNAVALREVYETPHTYYLVMDCCAGGELFEHITKSKVFTERHAAQILRSLMLFLAHMHSKGMAHMDIKPENIMFDSEGAQGVVKVIDFGSSIYIQPEETVRDAFGTVRYSSPEMAADENIGQKTDVWSAGIVMYFMLCGSAPFLKRDEVDTLNYIKNKPKVKFTGPRWATISQQAKDCISAMLEVEPEMRPSAQEVLQMAWLRTQGPDTSIQTDILLHLRTFANQSRMRRLLLGLMAANLSGSEANRLLNQFYSMDSDFSGTIELQELARVTQQALPDLDASEVEKLFHAMDLNHTGTVDVKEFFASLLHTMAPENQMAIARKSFVHLDREQSGFVSKEVFVDAMVQQAVASGMPQEETSTLVKELEQEFSVLDANSDGVLSFEEFKSVLGLSEGRAAAAAAAAGAGANAKTTAVAKKPPPGHSPSTSADGRAAAAAGTGGGVALVGLGPGVGPSMAMGASRVASSGSLLPPGAGLSGRPPSARATGGRDAVSLGGVSEQAGGWGGAGAAAAAAAASAVAGEGPTSSLVRLALALQETTRSRTATGRAAEGDGLAEQRSVSGSELERSHHSAAGHKRVTSSASVTSLASGAAAGATAGATGAAVRAPGASGSGVGTDRASRASPSVPNSMTGSRSVSNRNNPAAAAAAVTAAVAATVAASIPSDASDAARFHQDRSWPTDPASSHAASPHKTLSGRPAPRVVAYSPLPGDPVVGSGPHGSGGGWSGAPHHAQSLPSDLPATWVRDNGGGGFDAPSFAGMLNSTAEASDRGSKGGAGSMEGGGGQRLAASIPAVYKQQ